VPGGKGFARLEDGRSAFVDGALPGDRVLVRGQTDKKSYVEITRFDLETPSPERVTPACPVQAACGGCNWMALPYSAQRKYKAGLVSEALERTGGIRLSAPPEVVSAGEPLGYRLRVRLHVDDAGKVGFFGRRTQLLVEVPGCAVAAPVLEAPMARLRSLEPALKKTLGAHFAAVDLRAVPGDGGVELELEPREGKPFEAGPRIDALVSALSEHARVGFGAARRSGLRRYELPSGGFLRVPSGGFTQVNWAVNAALVSAVVAGAKSRGAASLLDLYAGVGNFALPLAREGLKGHAIELEHAAAAALREALREQGLVGLEVVSGDVAASLKRLGAKLGGVDLALLDPPRTGAKDAIDPLLALAPKAIAYVACDPVTLARDLKVFVARGWQLETLTCFDMFPQTHHVETLAWLSKETAAK
jgi:23S rRNA (uracil1939-C5)-methyltransferase